VVAIVFGLVAMASWGTGDWLALRVLDRFAASTVLVYTQTLGLVLIAPFALKNISAASGGLVVGALADGIILAAGYLAFYRALAVGPVSLVSPISSAWSGLAALLGVIFLGQSLGPVRAIGVVLLLLGAALAQAAEARHGGGWSRGVRIALGVVVLWGFGFFFLGEVASSRDAYVAIALAKLAIVGVSGLVVAMSTNTSWTGVAIRDVALFALIGALDVVAFVAVGLSAATDLVVTAPIAATYPALTVFLVAAECRRMPPLRALIAMVTILLGVVIVKVGTTA
jgi:uncharacterized membrane protein